MRFPQIQKRQQTASLLEDSRFSETWLTSKLSGVYLKYRPGSNVETLYAFHSENSIKSILH